MISLSRSMPALLALSMTAGVHAQVQTFELQGRVVALVDDLGVFTGVAVDDEASALLRYDPGADPLAPIDAFGRAEFEIQALSASFGGVGYNPIGPSYGQIAVGTDAFDGLSEDVIGLLPPEFFGVGADSARFFGSLAPIGGANSASINATFTGPTDWLDGGQLPGEEIFTSNIIETGNVVVSYATIGFVEVPCNDENATGPCFTLDLVESTAVIEVESVSSGGVTLWVAAGVEEEDETCFGDLNNDGTTDLGDFGVFGAAFGSVLGELNFNADCDFDGDGDVDLGDFGAFGNAFGCIR